MMHAARFTLILLTVSFSVSAEIYRCEIDGVVTFSDVACQPDARPYRGKGGLSVVSSPEDLDRTRQLNQTFVRERLDRQAARDEAVLRALL